MPVNQWLKPNGKIQGVIFKTHIIIALPRMAQNALEKIAQHLLESIDKVFPQKIDWSILQSCKQKKDEPVRL